MADGLLQRSQAAAHRWLGLAQYARRASESAFTRDGEEDAQVAPFHLASATQTELHGLRSISLIPMRVQRSDAGSSTKEPLNEPVLDNASCDPRSLWQAVSSCHD